ncbi:DUF4349 domain-containing protein [Aquimarina sp. 2201CG14-23]|uniref:DUF4349 domain-containing protein n=1 Tax=Aquimarina mycalae TaxID=3040073 RepID=UPI002477F1A7|nr:DUF4349 domain-containing protein [Aquimarina sp. 2201CG14-23]MDH7444868.1 DUF4349 domain-containing protein [Aquimarina sp. 2201CG14-23]
MKTNILKLIGNTIVIGGILLSFSCSQAEEGYTNMSEDIVMKETGETPSLNALEIKNEAEITDIDDKKEVIKESIKIIKNASCRIKVESVEKATRASKKIAARFNGYIADERFMNTNYSKENRFTIRVPRDNFDMVLDSICGLAQFIDHKNISTVDVTEEYVDISSRLKTKLEVKERYETILRTKAKSVEDVLLAEDKLRELQEEIEAAQGRLNYMSNKVSYSTIQLDIYETVVPKDEPQKYVKSFTDKATDGLSFGWNLLQNLFLILFYVWPLLLLGTVVFIYFKWIRK